MTELARPGVRYLSRSVSEGAGLPLRPASHLLAELARQPSSRVRLALIALLVSHPDYAGASQAAVQQLAPHEADLFQLLYTAAALLQREYAAALRPHLADNWQWLPDARTADIVPGEFQAYFDEVRRRHHKRTG